MLIVFFVSVAGHALAGTVSPIATTVPATGGTYNVSIFPNAPTDDWSFYSYTSGNANWISFAPSVGTGPGSVTMTISPHEKLATRWADFNSTAGGAHRVTQAGAAPHFTVSATTINMPWSGGSFPMTINCNSDLTWRTRFEAGGPMPSHFARNVPISGSGPETFNVLFQPNPLDRPYSRTLYIESYDPLVSPVITYVITVTQAGAPSFTNVSPDRRDVPEIGANYTLAIDSNTDWTITGVPTWATLSRTSGLLDGNVSISVPAYSGAPRSATLSINGDSHIISQDPSLLYVVPTPTNPAIPATGGSIEIAVQSNTDWAASDPADWLRLVSGSPGSGDGIVTYLADPNLNASSRSRGATVGGQMILFTQSAAPESTQLAPASVTVGNGGGSGSISVTSNATWTAVTADDWITIDAGASGDGNGQVDYTTGANPPGAAARSGAIQVNGETFAVNQVAGPEIVTFVDLSLEEVVREALGKPVGTLIDEDLLALIELDLTDRGVGDFSGLQYAMSLERLRFRGNPALDLAAAWAVLDFLPLDLIAYDVPRPTGSPAGLVTQTLIDLDGLEFFLSLDPAGVPVLDLQALGIDPGQPQSQSALQAFIAAGVANVSPVSVPSYSVINAEAGLVELDGSASYDFDGSISTFAWTWEGGAVTGENPTETFPSGKTSVTLTVTDDQGVDHSQVLVVEVFPPLLPGPWLNLELPLFSTPFEAYADLRPFVPKRVVAGGSRGAVLSEAGRLHISSPQNSIPNAFRWDLQDVSVSGNYIVVLLEDGSVERLGGGLNIPPEATSGVTAIATGTGGLTLALKDGEVLAWGYSNSYGQTDVPLAAQSDVIAIDANRDMAAALRSDGSVVVWGDGVAAGGFLPPNLQGGVREIAVGYQHVVALMDDDSVRAWSTAAGNSYGQATVPGGLSSGVVAVAAGWTHSLALKADGTVTAWGHPYRQILVPLDIQGRTVEIDAHESTSVARTDNGEVVAWGELGSDQLNQFPREATYDVGVIRDGPSHDLLLLDGVVYSEGGGIDLDPPVETQADIADIQVGDQHSVALTNDGAVIAWGSNSNGQIDVPLEAQSGVAQIVAGNYSTYALGHDGRLHAWGYISQHEMPESARTGVRSFDAGYQFAVALKGDGSLVAWGGNWNGQTDIPPEAQSGIQAVACGRDFVLALSEGGEVLAWGGNTYGQTNVPDEALSGVVAIAAGERHAVALRYDGTALAWGYSGWEGSVAPSTHERVVAISAGYRSTHYQLGVTPATAAFQDVMAATGLDGDDALPEAMPFGDGVSNLAKYAFNLNLAGPDAKVMTAGGTSGFPGGRLVEEEGQTYWRVEFVERIGSGLIYTPMKSTTLMPESFDPLSATPRVEPVDGEWRRVIYDEPCDPSNTPRCFSFVEVSLP